MLLAVNTYCSWGNGRFQGEVGYVDYVDINEFSVHEIDVIMLELGYPDPGMNEVNVSNSPVIYYHFKIPNGDFQFSLRALRNDQDVINLSKYIPHNKLIEIYTEHGKTNLVTYFMSSNAKVKVVIEELPEDDVQETEVHVESSLGNMNHVNDEHIGVELVKLMFSHQSMEGGTCINDVYVGNEPKDMGVINNETMRSKILWMKDQTKTDKEELLSKIWEKKKGATLGKYTSDYTKQYELLRDYVLELQTTNPDTIVKINVRSTICLDSNNGIYPLAYATVESGKTSSWKWFLENLRDNLELGTKSNFTFITNRKKGLMPAIARLFPNDEHMCCLKHIHDNMRKRWKQN
uniref:MULE transposase domain-containing protein n=1 Tax=Lactuca sativa TaxID=4236 RepID=A0A9R1WUK3_LACSA|nr:hypothetical protein LSAT_V11C900504390 [Lactuca sativa]